MKHLRYELALVLVLVGVFPWALPRAAEAAGIVVNSPADTRANDGACTLREAILNANADDQSGSTDCAAGSGADPITFSAAAPFTITLTSSLPTITAGSVITLTGPITTTGLATLNGNHAVRILRVAPGGRLTVETVRLVNGSVAGGDGGGILNEGTLAVRGSAFFGNDARYGGAVYSQGPLTISHSIFESNQADFGGALANVFATGGAVTIWDSVFVGNQAIYGGALAFQRGSIAITNTTFAENGASLSGGAIIAGSKPMILSNSTLINNTAPDGSAIENRLVDGDETLVLRNTLVANNSAGAGCLGPIVDGGRNLQFPGVSCGSTIPVSDPLVGALTGDPGSLRTYPLRLGSPALDAGDPAFCPATDQRGRPRSGPCDIGAFELQRHELWVTTPANTINSDGACSLPEALGNAANNDQSVSPDCAPGGELDVIRFAGDYTIVLNATQTLRGNVILNPDRRQITVSGNEAVRVFTVNAESSAQLNAMRVISGTSASSGGGVFVDREGWLALNVSSLIGNRAGSTTGNGGGLLNLDGTVVISASAIISNTAADFGGGIYNDGQLTLFNSTLSGNQAGASEAGGGLANLGLATLGNSTVANNRASSGGGLSNEAGTITIHNSLFVGNWPDACDVYAGTVTVTVNNLSDDGSCGLPTNGTLHVSPLGDYGGLTWTHALAATSPALDAADGAVCPTHDQRGAARVGRCDLGAYEFVPPTAPIAADDFTSTLEDTPLVIDALANDRDPNPEDRLSLQALTGVVNGNAQITTDQRIAFTPAPNFNGMSVLTYTVSDGALWATARVTIEVTAVNDPPTIEPMNDVTTTVGAGPVELPFVVGDVDGGDDLGVTAASNNPTLVTDPGMTVSGSGANRQLSLTPSPGQTGSAVLTLTVDDPHGGSAQRSFRLTVLAAPPPTATSPPSLRRVFLPAVIR